ncbi:ABC transporter permease [Planktotalea sp.]|uniref:ABC transporter permease n=1 Tax=Planktotalea sp. TaxID=2029877 RepID=UPI003F6AB907
MANDIAKIPPIRTLRLPCACRTIIALVLREMSTSYGRSPGGYIWAVAEPVAGIALLTFIFSLGFQAPPLGTSFALFYASGLVPFLIYSDVSGKIAQSINFSLPLLGYPRVTLIDAVLARTILSIVTQTLVCSLVFGGLFLFIGTQSRLDIAHLIQAGLMAFALGFGVGVMNCFLITMFPVWQRIWSIVNRPMFLLSCIVFVFGAIPLPYRDWLWYNPVVHIVGLTRQGLYFSYGGEYVSTLYVYFLSLGLSVGGFFLIWRFKDKLLNR